MPTEIERKFLVEKLPDGFYQLPSEKIMQGYLAVEPEGSEVRLRKKGSKYLITVKGHGNVAREEIEVLISKQQFEALWPMARGRSLEKERFHLPEGGLLFEVDIFKGKLRGLKMVEVEFSSVQESERFAPPAWFGEEVTHIDRYRNRDLALNGSPD